MGVSGVSEQTTQLGLFKWEDGPDRYNHVELYQNWDNIDSLLLRKGWNKSGDEATQLRFGASGTSTLAATALIVKSFTGTSDTQDRFSMAVSGSASWGPGGTVATDVNLYRSGTGQLTTSGTFNAANYKSSGGFNSERAGTASSILAGSVTGDTNPRYNLDSAGVVTWGAGNAAVDTNLYRSSANTLKTDDSFIVGSGALTLNDFALTRSGAGTLTADGNVVITGNITIDGDMTLSGSAFQGDVSLSHINSSSLNISGNGTIANLVVSTSSTFNGAATANTFASGLNVNGYTVTRPGAGTLAFAGDVTFSAARGSGRVIAENGESSQVAIGSKGGTATITFGLAETLAMYLKTSTTIGVDGSLVLSDTLYATDSVEIYSPSVTSKKLNVGGDIFVEAGSGIYFGNASKAASAGNRLIIHYGSGNGYIDVDNFLYIRGDGLNSIATFADTNITTQVPLNAYGEVYLDTLSPLYFSGIGATSGSRLDPAVGIYISSSHVITGAANVKLGTNIDMQGNSVINLSDSRLKDNFTIVQDRDILADFGGLYVSSWNWIDSDKNGIGPTAQQLQQTSLGSRLVDNSDEDGYLRVNNTNAQGVLFAAVSALTRKVKELERKLG